MSYNNAPRDPRNQPRRSERRPQASYDARYPQQRRPQASYDARYPQQRHPQASYDARYPQQRRPQEMSPDRRPSRAVILIYVIMALLIVGVCIIAISAMLKNKQNSPGSGGNSAVLNANSSDNSQGSAPEAPTSSGTASEPASSVTVSEPTSSGNAADPVTSSVKPAEQPDTSYETDPPASSDGLTILGPNMVYSGEDFSYSCKAAPGVEWECVGDSGTITDDGKFTALKRGEVTLIARDTANNATGKLLVHVVGSADEVDFVPMVNNIPVVNKTYPLPSDYDPGGLTAETNAAFKKLVDGAAADGINIFLVSGYRSYTKQQSTYTYWCNVYGNTEADRISARPGFSEHQLGMAIDVNSLEESFADTAEGKWLKEHCWEYGFIIRYPKEKEHLTGYAYEPWHIRYLGKDLAKKVTDSGLCLEEYLGIDSGYRG